MHSFPAWGKAGKGVLRVIRFEYFKANNLYLNRMKHKILRCLLFCLVPGFAVIHSCNQITDVQSIKAEKTVSLPNVLPDNHSDITEGSLRLEAFLKYSGHQLPQNTEEWKTYSEKLRSTIIEKAGVVMNHDLPLEIMETGRIQMKGYTVRNIYFQTLPGIYATANLYIPDGKGPFPAVINMLGHWTKGKIDSTGPQAVGHSLAVNGYICLTIDPWGAGERSTKHGQFEYHGAGLGASLMNIGEPLIGIQISDNMRGVDLLCSLPEADPSKIGATGASGGGNQSMWLAAVDQRVKAVVPVVSVGTFESYVMRSNCICELLNDGLTFTEEAGVLALANAVMPCNHTKDIETFHPSETARSYNNAVPVFKMLGLEKKISRQVFELTHGYFPQDREAMLGWFDLHLKGTGTGIPRKEIPFKQLSEEKLMVFHPGQRNNKVISTDEYCRNRGIELRASYLDAKSFNTGLKRKELQDILRIFEKPHVKNAHQHKTVEGWERFSLETSDNKLIPVLHYPPVNKSAGYVIVCSPEGKGGIELSLIDKLKEEGSGIVIADLSGTGEVISTKSLSFDQTGKLHTLARAELWLGKTILGEWVKELEVITQFLNTNYKSNKISIYGYKEAGLAGLFLGIMKGNIENITLRDAPLSYLFDNRESVDFFSMGIHLPGFLKWGDLSLAAALSGKNITFINPVTMSGTTLSGDELKAFRDEYENVRKICKTKGIASFN